MKPENKALLVMVLASLGVVAVGGATVYYLGGNVPPSVILVPFGSFSLQFLPSPAGRYWTAFTYSNNRTASYTVTGTWSASAPVQVIVGEVLGLNMAGCGFVPLNYPSGAPADGCWPSFEESPEGSFNFTFHICVSPKRLPTGSFILIFLSTSPATVTVMQPFIVQESGFPQSSCPSSGL